ncbi:MAG: polysaccharide pyruvyl transferase family protein [Actinobacteria bacterium]|nr:polysaccharide pyruvyl transferase family protein [Actinomycetota bacterium]
MPNLDFIVFDNGKGSRPPATDGPDGVNERIGVRSSRRIHRPESWTNIRACARVGGLWNRAAHAILDAEAILDISGGDSFTDLYGERRFRSVTAPKQAAMDLRRPLILLPQTLGPFEQPTVRSTAARILRHADQLWARGQASLDVARELLGSEFDPQRHRLGVDVAFGLEARPPSTDRLDELQDWWERQGRVHAGLNVSGLIYFGQERYGLIADYKIAIRGIVKRLVEHGGASVVLVPHVLGLGGHESDEGAIRQIVDSLPPSIRHHVRTAPARLSAAETKWLISRFEWFCGTRMHSAIAGLASGVPTSAIAYSFKTREVFGQLGEAEKVVDPRRFNETDVVDRLWEHWEDRRMMKDRLVPALEHLDRRWRQQMAVISARLAMLSPDPGQFAGHLEGADEAAW